MCLPSARAGRQTRRIVWVMCLLSAQAGRRIRRIVWVMCLPSAQAGPRNRRIVWVMCLQNDLAGRPVRPDEAVDRMALPRLLAAVIRVLREHR